MENISSHRPKYLVKEGSKLNHIGTRIASGFIHQGSLHSYFISLIFDIKHQKYSSLVVVKILKKNSHPLLLLLIAFS